MEARVQKWGNSAGIRIPSSILKSLNIKTNDILNIIQEDDKIIISIPKKKKISLSDRFKEYTGLVIQYMYHYNRNVNKDRV